ncbi:TPA: Abi family protein [Enterococcus faecalis]|nr:Abi family protein [Enterococcus faecalis]
MGVFLFWRKNMKEPLSLSFDEQMALFEERGMQMTSKDVEKLKVIGYYRIKQFAAPLANKKIVNENTVYDYKGIYFSDVLKRYYQDKNLRIHLLHAIEKIEVALKTWVAFILGEQYGAFGYLNFSKWCDKNRYSKFEIEKRQFFFKKDLLRATSRSCTEDIKLKKNKEKDNFPSIWLAVEVLTFGELVRLVEIMSTRNKRKLSKMFRCTDIELLSWLKCINFVRNACAHNANVIDLQLETKPVCRSDWKDYLYNVNKSNNGTPSNKLAIVIFIIKTLVTPINERYGWKNIRRNIARLVDSSDKNAHLLGFSDCASAYKVLEKSNGTTTKASLP